ESPDRLRKIRGKAQLGQSFGVRPNGWTMNLSDISGMHAVISSGSGAQDGTKKSPGQIEKKQQSPPSALRKGKAETDSGIRKTEMDYEL
ncbi:hypothetical protein HAX54_031561, partial [Datura stramonium]|nr:hypothetical protein [Datura stramonium]